MHGVQVQFSIEIDHSQTLSESLNFILEQIGGFPPSCTEEEKLLIARTIHPVLVEQFKEAFESNQILIDSLNAIKTDFEKKLLLAMLGLSKNDMMYNFVWRSKFISVDTFEFILDSITNESDKQLFIDDCVSEYTIAYFCDTHPHLKSKIDRFIDIHASSFAEQTRLARESKVITEDLLSLFNHTKNHTKSGLRGWDGLIVYSYFPVQLEQLEPFLCAAKTNDLNEMRAILVSDRQTQEAQSLLSIRGGYSNLLILCAENNLIQGVAIIIEELIFRKQTVINEANQHAISHMISHALRYAKNIEVATIMLNAGAELAYSDESGHTALTYACQGSSPDLVEFYLTQGADIEEKTKDGDTPLIAAVSFRVNIDIVALLLRHGANICAKNHHNESVLSKAVEKPAIMRVLLEHHASVNSDNHDLHAVLYKAVLLGAVESTQLLLEYGADIYAGDDRSLLAIARKQLGMRSCALTRREFGKAAQLIIDRNSALTAHAVLATIPEVVALNVDTNDNSYGFSMIATLLSWVNDIIPENMLSVPVATATTTGHSDENEEDSSAFSMRFIN